MGIVLLLEFVSLDEVRMVPDSGYGSCLSNKAVLELVINLRIAVLENCLDRCKALQGFIKSLVDHAHATPAKFRIDFVHANPLSAFKSWGNFALFSGTGGSGWVDKVSISQLFQVLLHGALE